MGRWVLIVAGLIFSVLQADAQSNEHQKGWSPSPPDAVSSFQPSLAAVIGILCVMFFVTFILLIYAKCCHRGTIAGNTSENGPRLVRSASRFSGINKTVIESLPFFRFSSLKGLRDDLECSVCLSKFEDVEILRLLPKCKHAFHINCVDAWLENHSSCPLCRCKVNPDDPSIFTYSNSMRFMLNQSEPTEDSDVELFVQREGSHRGSSRFSVGSSFRKIVKLPDPEDQHQEESQTKALHKFNHKIVVSDVVFQNRWSNVSSSDLMLLKSEMLNDMSSDRFTNPEPKLPPSSSEISNRLVGPSHPASILTSPGDRRAISEITSLSRYRNLDIDDDGSRRAPGERARRVWIPIARRTVQWFSNREKMSQQVGV